MSEVVRLSFGTVSKDVKAGEFRVVVPASGRAGLSTLSLEVGKSLLARVVAQNAEEVTLSLLGRLVACRSELELPQGGLVNLLVREVRPDRIVLSPQPLPSESGSNAAGEQEILRSLGLPDSPEAVLVAKRLLAEGHPLEQRLFQEVWQGLKRLGLIERPSAANAGPATTASTAANAGPATTASTAPNAPAAGQPGQADRSGQAGQAGGTGQAGQTGQAGETVPVVQAGSAEQAVSPSAQNAAQSGNSATAAPAAQSTGQPVALPGAQLSDQTVMQTGTQTAIPAGTQDPMATVPVTTVPAALAALDGHSLESVVDAVAFLVANERPVTPDAVRATLAVRDSAPDLGQLVGDLTKAIGQLAAAQARDPFGGYTLPAGLLDDLREIQTLLADVRFSPLANNASLDVLSGRLEDVLAKLGLNYEHEVGQLFAEAASDDATERSAALANLADDVPPVNASPAPTGRDDGAENQSLGKTAALPRPAGEVADQAARAAADPRTTLKGLLLSLRDRLTDLGGTPAHTAAGRPAGSLGGADDAASLARLAKTAAEALDNLTGQRLTGQASERPGQPPVELLVQIPVQVGKETHTAELKFFVDREKKNRHSLLKDTIRVSCRLTTTNLGPVRLDLNLRGKSVDCHLTLANEKVLAYMHEHQAELERALQDAGFTAGSVSYARQKQEEAAQVTTRPLSHLNVRL